LAQFWPHTGANLKKPRFNVRLSALVLVLLVSCARPPKPLEADAQPARWSKPALPPEVLERLSKRDASMPERRTRLVKLPDGTLVEEQLR
jgi:hypothetical protein